MEKPANLAGDFPATEPPEFIFGEKSSKLYPSCLAWLIRNVEVACQRAVLWYNKKIPNHRGGYPEEKVMSEYAWLAFFSFLIAAFALFGGLLPFRGEISHTRLQFYLTFSAGVMIGAAFFHVMPDAIEQSGKEYVGVWMALAVVGLFCIERFIAPHSHEVNDHHHEENSGEKHLHHEHEHEADHEHSHTPLPEYRAAAPAVAGWMAVLGLTIHSFMNGVGLAGSVENDLPKSIGFLGIPGL